MRRKEQLIDHGLIKLFLFALVMLTPFTAWAQTTYNLWIGETQVTDANKADVLGDGKVVFSVGDAAAIYTLTLNGATLTAPIITGMENLTIDIQGNNKITTNGEDAIAIKSGTTPFVKFLTSTSDGYLTLINTKEDDCGGVFSGDFFRNNEYQFELDKSVGLLQPEGPNNYYRLISDTTHIAKFVPSLGVAIGDVPVYVENQTDVLGDGTVSFGDGVLTLKNAQLTDPIKTSLANLTIDLKGNNTMFVDYKDDGFQSIAGEAVALSFKSTSETVGNLSIDLNSVYTGILGANVTVDVENGYQNGLEASDDLKSTSVTKAVIGPHTEYGLTVAGVAVTNLNANNILNDNETYHRVVYTHNYSDNTGTLSLKGATLTGGIVSSLAGLTIYLNGTTTIQGSTTAIETGIKSTNENAPLNFTRDTFGGRLTITVANTTTSSVVSGFASVTLADGLYYEHNVPFRYHSTEKKFIESYNGDVVAIEMKITSDTHYPLWIAGNQVTPTIFDSGNALGTFADKLTYTHNNNTLALSDANLNNCPIVSGLDNLKVKISGTNTLQSDSTRAIRSIVAGSTISFEKGGDGCKLTMSSYIQEGKDKVITGFSNIDSPTLVGSLCWLPKKTDEVTSAVVMDSPFAGGTGAEGDPFQIADYGQLKSFAELVNNGTLTTEHVKLNADITGANDFTPIGTGTNPFKGTFDGNSKTISNLTMTNVNNDVVGFFTYNKGTITNLTLSGCTISGGSGSSNYIGMLVGENNGSVSGCTVKNSNVSCNADSQIPSVGGIAGITSNAITNCVVENTNVNAVTSDGGASGAVARAGGIAAYQTDGTVSGCVVKGTTTVASDYSNLSENVYAGAIIGEAGGTVSGNTYESTVVTKTRKQGDTDYTVKSGQTQRGFGNGDDVLEKVQLYGVKTVTVYVPDAIGNYKCEPVEGTYYMFNYPKIYVLPGSTFTYSMTPSNGYKPSFTLSDNTIEVTSEEKTNAESGSYDHTEFSFTMPEADLTATLSFVIDLASNNYTATIADVAYTSEAVVLGTVSLSYNDDEITPFTKDTQYTIEGYKSAKLEALDAAPVNVGTYHVTIKGVEAQGYTGTKDVQFNITQAENSLTTTPAAVVELAYTGEAQELVTAGVAKFGDVQYKLGADGIYSATIPTATDANTTGYTVYYKVEGTDNYAGIEEASIVVSIAKADATITKAPTANDLTYTGEAQALVEAGTVSAGTMVYSTTLTGTFSETIPTGTNADTYSVYYKVNGDDNYNGIDASVTNKVEVEIKKATITEVTLENPSLSYTGEEQTATIASVKAGDLVLTTNDYDVSNNKATDKGSYELTVTAKENSNFKGSAKAAWSIINRLLKVGEDGDVQFATGQTWASFYTEIEDLNLPEGLMAYIVTAADDKSATLKAINYVPKSVPVFLENGSTTITTNTSAEGNLLYGSSAATDVSNIPGTVYALHNNKLMKVTSGYIQLGRAYLRLNEGSAAPQLSMIIDGGGTTGIDNGELKIDNSVGDAGDVWYDLQGRKLLQKPMKKGLYIMNGKTVVVNNK